MTRAALALSIAFVLAGCDEVPPAGDAVPVVVEGTAPLSHPTVDETSGKASSATPVIALHTGIVKETLASGGYTYVLLKTSEETLWVAGPETTLAVGDEITVPTGALMTSFRSDTLDRTFDEILFVAAIHTGTVSAEAKACHAPPAIEQVAEFNGAGTENGYAIGEIYASAASLEGKAIAVRGQVAKYSPAILGTNWIHIQDGTGSIAGKTYDLTITTADVAAIGDIVLVNGTLHTNRDFGAGYHYDVLIEEAKVVVEGKVLVN